MTIELQHQLARTVPIAVLDLEMTGLDPENDRVCEVAVVRGEGGRVVRELQTLVRPQARMSPGARKVHGISDEMLATAPTFAQVAPRILEILEGAVVVCHNVPFDLGFLHREFDEARVHFAPPVTVDTLYMSRRLFALPRNNLGEVCRRMGVDLDRAHRALSDARATFGIYHRMLELLDPECQVTVQELNDLIGALAPNSPLRLRQQQVLRDAYREHRTVWIRYQSMGSQSLGVTHREIGIYRLRLPKVQAWCYLREGERVFRLDRIRSVRKGERDYEIPGDLKPRI